MMYIKKVCDRRSTTLYDVGGWFIISALYGVSVLVGVVIDYFWNYIVFSLSLRWLHFDVRTHKKFIFCLIITVMGLVIDWLYYEFTWGYRTGFLRLGNMRVPSLFSSPGSQPFLEISSILIPMIIIAVVSFTVAYLYLHMKTKQATILGIIMGVFTAPWLILVYVMNSAW